MANTNVKPARAPKAPKVPKPVPEEVETVLKPEVEVEPVASPEPEVLEPVAETKPVEKTKPVTTASNCTTVYLVQKGEKYNVYRDGKKLTRNLVNLDKAKLVARAYGESNPTIK